jgi:hypothetical protein
VFRVAFSPGINLAMIMCFKLYPFSYFEFALNLFMSEVGCCLAELSSMSLLFVSVFQWLQSGFRISTLIALVLHKMERISMDETLKINAMRYWIYTIVENLNQLFSCWSY